MPRLTDEPTYEELERELEQIVTRLEQGQVSLDEAIALWERGEQLYKLCVGKLDSAQGRIEEKRNALMFELCMNIANDGPARARCRDAIQRTP